MLHALNYIKKHKLLWLLIFVGFVAHLSTIFPSGTSFCYQNKCGIYFIGIHGYDMIWHLALSSVAFNTIPFTMPIFAGEALGGYNYLMDLVVFLISKVGIPNLITYFKILPNIWFVLITFAVIRYGLTINRSPLFVALLLLLIYFCGSFAYFLTLWHHGTILGSSAIVAIQALQTLTNVQFALSLIVIVEVLILLKKPILSKRDIIFLSILVFINMGIKFYGGVITIFLVEVYLFLKIFPIRQKKIMQNTIYGSVVLLAAVLSIILFYNPFVSTKTGGIFSFIPFATIHPIIENPELVHLPDMVNARYILQGHIGPRLIYIESVTLGLFLIFNYGIRLFGIIYVLWKVILRKVNKEEVAILLSIILATLLNVLFVQKAEWWNTVQFLYYGIFLSTILTAQFLYTLIEKKKIYLTILAGLIILSVLPTNFDVIHGFARAQSLTYLPKDEVEATTFLKQLPNGVVFQPLYNEKITTQYTYPYPQFANYDSAYLPAFSGKQVYYTNKTQLRLMGVDYNSRLDRIKNGDCSVMNEIDYAYIVKDYRDEFFSKCIVKNKKFKRIFNNKSVWIYGKI